MPEVKPTHQTPDGSKWIKVETPLPLPDRHDSFWQRVEDGKPDWFNAGLHSPFFGQLTPIPQPVVRYAGVFLDGGMTSGWLTKSELLRACPDITHVVTISTIPGEMPVVSVEAVRR